MKKRWTFFRGEHTWWDIFKEKILNAVIGLVMLILFLFVCYALSYGCYLEQIGQMR